MLPDGIYFGLPAEAYHADTALGSSDLKALLVNPVQWHFSNRNPAGKVLLDDEQAKAESAGKRFGSALHTIILEPDQFEARYCIQEEAPDLPRTKEQIAEALKAMGRTPPKVSDKRDLFVSAARLAGVEVLDDWSQREVLRTAGREALSPRWWRSLQLTRRALEAHSEAGKFVRNGYAEVSVFWTDENGIRLKVRFDYLRQRTVTDVKTYALREGVDPVECFVQAMTRYAYDFSAAHYMHARREVFPRLAEAGAMFDCFSPPQTAGNDYYVIDASAERREFCRKAAAWDKPTWWWVACMTQGAPEVDAIQFPESLMGYCSANAQVDIAKQKYREFRDRFGEDDESMWMDDRGLVTLTDYNFSSWATGRGEARWERIET